MTEEGGSEEVKPIRISIASGTAAGVSLLQGLLNAVRAYTPRNCKNLVANFFFGSNLFNPQPVELETLFERSTSLD